MRLTQVNVDDAHAIQPLLQFYMGKNTPQRREYIMGHLVASEAAPQTGEAYPAV
jgi:topoisomerase IV subunit B